MLRKRAIRSLLVEQVAGLRPREAGPDEPAESTEPERAPGDASSSAAVSAAAELEALKKAVRRALLMVGLDWIALAVLFLLRDRGATFLPMDGTVETVFTLGVIAVAIHSGFRLGQLEKYRAVSRAYDELLE